MRKPCRTKCVRGLLWCKDHRIFHFGTEAKLAKEMTERASKMRLHWDTIYEHRTVHGMTIRPRWMTLLFNFARDMGKVIYNLIFYQKIFCTKWQRELREKVCRSCRYFDHQKEVCNHGNCGCTMNNLAFMPGAWKLRAKSCPIGEWERQELIEINLRKLIKKHELLRKTPFIPRHSAGVVIGSYGMPGVVELSVAAIRKYCGAEIPILINDDRTPTQFNAARLQQICEKYPNVTLITNEVNLGHAPGDLRALRNGLLWAYDTGIEYLVKLSQRFIPIQQNWVQNHVEDLRQSGKAFSCQPCIHQHLTFPMRSEAYIVDVKRAVQNETFLSRIDRDKIHAATEDWVHAAFAQSSLGEMHRFRIMPRDRFNKYHDLLWHNTDGIDEYGKGGEAYYRLAKELGIDLGPEFSAAGWHIIAQHRPDANYHML